MNNYGNCHLHLMFSCIITERAHAVSVATKSTLSSRTTACSLCIYWVTAGCLLGLTSVLLTCLGSAALSPTMVVMFNQRECSAEIPQHHMAVTWSPLGLSVLCQKKRGSQWGLSLNKLSFFCWCILELLVTRRQWSQKIGLIFDLPFW